MIIKNINMVYPKMIEFIETIWSIFNIIHKKAKEQKDRKLEIISLTIYNYVSYLAKTYDVKFKDMKKESVINLVPFFEYVTFNNIEFYDLNNIQEDEVNLSSKSDLERYVLTYIYDISQRL